MADIEVELPTGAVLVFPEGTAPEKIREVSRKAAASPGYSSTDPNRTEADFWHDVQDDVVKQHPIAARAATALQGVPFVGQYADEVVGYFSPEAGRAMRVSQEAMADTRPGQTAALQIGGAVAGSIPLAAAAGPTAIAAMPQSLAGRALVGAGIGAAAGGLEGAVSGYGAGNDGNRAQAAQDYGVAGAAMGGAMGAAAPMAAAGLRNFVGYIKGSDIAEIASTLGISKGAARAVREALDGDELARAGQRFDRAGPNAMLVEAGPSTLALGDAVGNAGGEATRVMRGAVEQRSAAGTRQAMGALDDAFKPGTSVIPKPPKIGTAYDAAYSKPIDYSGAAGQKIEGLMKNVPQSVRASARNLIEMDPDIPDQIKRQFLISIQPDGSIKTGTLPSVLELDYITRALNDVAKAGDGKGALGGNTNQGRLYGKLSKTIRDNLKTAVPEYRTALEYASTEIGIKEARDFGETILNPSVTRREVFERLNGAPQAEKLAAKASVREALDDKLANVKAVMSNPGQDTSVREAIQAVRDLSSRANKTKLATLLGQKEADKLLKEIDQAATAFEVQAAMHQNSKTAIRQSVQGSVRETASPGAIRTLMQGEPINATKRFVQILTGSTPEAQQAVESGIYTEIAKALTGIKGDQAKMALSRLQWATAKQSLTDAQAHAVARSITSALAAGGYRAGTLELQSR